MIWRWLVPFYFGKRIVTDIEEEIENIEQEWRKRLLKL